MESGAAEIRYTLPGTLHYKSRILSPEFPWGQGAGVKLTLGLPIVRTPVDHGTAFDKAGPGSANPQSMLDAIRVAALLSRRLKKEK